jgi:hypothetical protein
MEGMRNPLDNSLTLSVSLHSFGTSRKVRPEMVETDADRTLLKVSKKIFGCNAMDQIKEIDGQIREHLGRYTISNALMKPGIYLVPLDHVERVETFIAEKKSERDYWVYQLGEEYERSKTEYMSKLGSLANESDYPDVESVKAKFSIEYNFLAMDIPAKLQYINHRIWASEQEKAQARISVVAERVEQVLIASMQDLVDHLVERLTDTDDGKRKKFATNMVDKARGFFETFQSRNLTGAESLNALAEQGLSLLEGVDLESLKDQAGMRERVRTGFESIKASMASMITVAPRRALNLQDEIDAVAQADYEAEVASVTPISDTDMAEQVELSRQIIAEVIEEEGREAAFLAAQEHAQETAANVFARVPAAFETDRAGEELSLF